MSYQDEYSFSSSQLIDQKSFELIYERHWKSVYAVCYNNLKNVEIAQGMVQDIFLSLWERRATLIITTPIEHYLVRAAKMKVFEYIRNKTIRDSHLATIRAETTEATNTTEREVEYNSFSEQLQQLVAHLPAQCRQVFGFRQQGMSNKDIAYTLQISEKAVEYHITKALQFLKSNLGFVFDH